MNTNVVPMPASSPHLVKYDQMCRAIAEAYKVDEVKDIRDKAMAIEVYAKQAKNVEAERQACEIRLRAERRCGQLLRDIDKQHGARGNPGGQGAKFVGSANTSPQTTLGDLGVSHDQSSNWQKLAAVPDEAFEQAVKAEKPTTSGIIAAHAEPKLPKKDQVDTKALWLWGRLLDFEREGLLAELDPNALLQTMLPHMKETTQKMAPIVAAWLGRIQ